MTFDRASGIGGSDVPAILRLSPFRSRWDVWLEKTGDPAYRAPTQTPAMEFGNLVEPVLANAYERDHPGSAVERYGGSDTEPIWHPNGIMYMHKDGVITTPDGGHGLWEGKSTRNDREWSAGVPEHYKAQVYAYLAISGEPWADVTVLFRDTATFAHYRLEADPALQDGVVRACEEFWRSHVVPRVPPEMDASDAAARYLAEKYPAPTTGDILPPDPDFEAAVRGLLDTRDGLARLQANETLLVNVLKSKMGEYPYAEGGDWRITWKRTKGFPKIGWEEVAGAYRGILHQVLAALRGGRPEEALKIITENDPDTIVGLYTKITEGSRPFIVRSAKDKE